MYISFMKKLCNISIYDLWRVLQRVSYNIHVLYVNTALNYAAIFSAVKKTSFR